MGTLTSSASLAFADRPDAPEPRSTGDADMPPGRQHRAQRRRPPHEPDRLEGWLRHAPQVMGIVVLLAAVVVLLWPGALLPLALGALALGLLLLLAVAVALLLAGRRLPR